MIRADSDRRRTRRLIALLAAAVFACAGIGSFSLALFSDTATVDDNTFGAATLRLAASPAEALISYTAMAPGDRVSGELRLENTGSLELRYAMTTAAGDADGKGLRDQLDLAIRTLGAGCAAFDGTLLYDGPLAGAAIGDPATGQDAGDRTLVPAAAETLCFRASLPLATGDAFQAATTTVTFTFDAEQTAHND